MANEVWMVERSFNIPEDGYRENNVIGIFTDKDKMYSAICADYSEITKKDCPNWDNIYHGDYFTSGYLWETYHTIEEDYHLFYYCTHFILDERDDDCKPYLF